MLWDHNAQTVVLLSPLEDPVSSLTAVFFETGAMPVPTKLQNPTICGSGDPFHSYLTNS